MDYRSYLLLFILLLFSVVGRTLSLALLHDRKLIIFNHTIYIFRAFLSAVISRFLPFFSLPFVNACYNLVFRLWRTKVLEDL